MTKSASCIDTSATYVMGMKWTIADILVGVCIMPFNNEM